MTLDLTRVLTHEERSEIDTAIATTWDADEVTVGDVIASMAGIGYGGHFDECSDEEDAAHYVIARHNVGTDDGDVRLELTAIDAARNEYTKLVRAAAEAVEWPS